ncbi:MAG: DUF1631 family protein [Arenimonas sp.]|nr:DUF1631 family protein [Arenimonas sp.]MBP6310166.1 DUF1631 family protein [Arenimonas sp.]
MNDILNKTITKGPFPGHEALYQKVLFISRTRLCDILSKSLVASDKTLNDICQQDQSTLGNTAFEYYKLFRTASPSLDINFKYAIDACFSEYKKQLSSKTIEDVKLQLIEMNEMEVVVITELIAESISRKFAGHIAITSKRFCALLGLQDAEAAKTPLTEKHLIQFLRTALQGLELPDKLCALIYRNYEVALIESLPDLFAAVNEPMIAAGILPQVKIQDVIAKSQSKPGPGQGREGDARNTVEKPTQVKHSASEFHHVEVEHRSASQASTADLASSSSDHALFDELCNYLHSWRPQHEPAKTGSYSGSSNGNAPRSTPRRSLATHEMISVLSMLQASLPDNIASSMQGLESSISNMLKSEMVRGAKKFGLEEDSYEINRDDEDAVDLVGMLFDVLATERDFRDDAKAMMSRLVVPYTKAAVLDKRLFLTKAHPARKLLNSLTEAVEGNKGDGPQDRELLNKAESTVDRLVAEFNEDIAIFELLEQEMRAHMDQHKRRIDLAEKRAKEAQRGQERLENARMVAARELEARTQNIELPTVIQDFFARFWTHHLSMISLRDGEDSVAWGSAIQLAKDIMTTLNSMPAEARYERILFKHAAMESVFSSSGVIADSAKAFIHKIAESASQYQAIQSSREDLAQSPSKESSLSESALHLVFNKDALDYENADVEYFKTLEIGTWLQLVDSKGSFSPIKLAWVSPISSRLMFVNRRGVRVLVVSVEELAQMKKQAKLIVHDKENVFDQTLDRVLDRLKSDLA